MIFPLFRRNRRPDTISALYGMIVAQARSPAFYRDYGVADTVNGRFDLLLLHLVLVIERLMREEDSKDAAQALFDMFCTDIDENLREIGIGDLSVPKHMKRVGEAYYGRAQVYQAALAASGDDALVEAIGRNVDGGPNGPAATRLAAYMRLTAGVLGQLPVQTVVNAGLTWPDPAAVPAADEGTPIRG